MWMETVGWRQAKEDSGRGRGAPREIDRGSQLDGCNLGETAEGAQLKTTEMF